MTDLHLPLDRSAGRLATQIAAGFRAAIRSGRLAPGTRLPSSRDLSRDLDVSRGVVVAAYEQLVAEGFLLARRGDGTRVAPLARPDETPPPRLAPWDDAPTAPAPQAKATVRRAPAVDAPSPRAGTSAAAHDPAAEPRDAGGEFAYDLWPGIPDLAAFPRARWLATMRAVLRDVPNDELIYPDPAGVPALRAELAGYLGRVRAAHAGPEQVLVMNGVAQGLAATVRLLAEEGHRVLAVEDPTSVRQLPMLEATGIRLVRVPVDRDGLDVDALVRTQARAVLVTPAHQYPTGVVLAPHRRAALIAWARRTGGLILEDDYDAEFRYDRDPVGCMQGIAPEHVVLFGSVSKSLAPAMRLGWAVAPPHLAERLRAYRAQTDLGNPVLEQYALARFIADGGYDRHLRVMRRQYRSRRDALVKALRAHAPNAAVRGISAGIHLYLELPRGCDEEAVVASAARAGVAVAGAAPMWSAARAGQAPPALVLGYARLPEARLARAAELLGRAITEGAGG
ncbi:PLP-dependent aminotransferase family protein [Actinomadura sp. NPDC047616]|uniref:MocR-like pyridoxine biosynthesis transcription factor PdxR n=1 Tax=Actinomadura sp. NPDC047616 TaxID=3155914 RepID=UPI0033FC2DF0